VFISENDPFVLHPKGAGHEKNDVIYTGFDSCPAGVRRMRGAT
jgi:hypothetical protein